MYVCVCVCVEKRSTFINLTSNGKRDGFVNSEVTQKIKYYIHQNK
jgi:hypothetical protein